MYRVINELKQIPILNSTDLQNIKNQLEDRLIPHEQRPYTLAQIVHQVLDQHLPSFSQEHRQEIKQRLLHQGINQGRFYLAADDLFISSLLVQPGEENYFRILTEWVNELQQYSLTPTQVQNTAAQLSSCPTNPWKWDFSSASIDIPFNLPITDSVGIPNRPANLNPLNKLFPRSSSSFVALLSLGILVIIIMINLATPSTETPARATDLALPSIDSKQVNYASALPDNLLYHPIDTQRLQAYLTTKNSLLAQEPYFSTIIKVSEEFNLNPLLLFAITGQEQAFVPRSHPQAKVMANNPYNVFHSWKQYNTDINDSSRIAARTVINLSKNRPRDTNPFQWINRKYAQDQNWWKGVSRIYQQLEQAATLPDDPILKSNP